MVGHRERRGIRDQDKEISGHKSEVVFIWTERQSDGKVFNNLWATDYGGKDYHTFVFIGKQFSMFISWFCRFCKHRHRLLFPLNYHFKDVFGVENHERHRLWPHFEQKAYLFTVCYKTFRFPKLGSSPYSTHCFCKGHQVFFLFPCEN